jgi:predicted DNA-binding transcriptional regulator AlpA
MAIKKTGQNAVGIAPEGRDSSADELIRGYARVCSEAEKSRTQLWRDIRVGTFPAPIEIGPNSLAWWRSEIKEWKATRPRRTYGRAVSATPETDDLSPGVLTGAFASLDALSDAEPQARRRGRPRRDADAAE